MPGIISHNLNKLAFSHSSIASLWNQHDLRIVPCWKPHKILISPKFPRHYPRRQSWAEREEEESLLKTAIFLAPTSHLPTGESFYSAGRCQVHQWQKGLKHNIKRLIFLSLDPPSNIYTLCVNIANVWPPPKCYHFPADHYPLSPFRNFTLFCFI